jgi:hypothetical protein
MTNDRVSAALCAGLFLLITSASGHAWSAASNCTYPGSNTKEKEGGMGGTGIVTKGSGMGGTGRSSGMGGTGSKPEADMNSLIAGTVTAIEGKTEAQQNGLSRLLTVNASVCVGEVVVTNKSGKVKIRMADGGLMEIHSRTRIRIEKFVWGQGRNNQSLIALLDGSARFVTGQIGKEYPGNVWVKTPAAYIGVHGTDHVATVILPGANEGYSAGTYDMVNTGVTFLRMEHGEIDIQPNQVGFAAFEGEAPTLLHDIPVFYLEDRATMLHENRPEINTRESEDIHQMDQLPNHADGEHEHFDPMDNVPSIIEHHDIEDIPDIPELNEHAEHTDLPEQPQQPGLPQEIDN